MVEDTNPGTTLSSPRNKEMWGYVIWGIALIVILVPEITAASDKRVPWPTISSTVGHLEYMKSWVGLIVVAAIACVTYQLIMYPLATSAGVVSGRLTRTGHGRMTRRRGSPPDVEQDVVSVVMAITLIFVIGLGSLITAEVDPSDRFVLAYVLYGLIASCFIVLPSVLAFCFARDISFPTLFRTIANLERRAHFIAVLLVMGLAILMVHLALYPWPGIFHQLRPPTVSST